VAFSEVGQQAGEVADLEDAPPGPRSAGHVWSVISPQ
jgi:hypothetical protein